MEEIEAGYRCPFWQVCGGGIVHQYWAQQTPTCSDLEKKYITTYCCDENKYKECPHYQLRVKPKEVKGNEAI